MQRARSIRGGTAQPCDGHIRIERQADLLTQAATDLIEHLPGVGKHFQVDDERIRAGFHEAIEETAGILHHQVNFERPFGDGSQPLHDHRPHAEIRNEVAVHHIDMNAIRPGRIDLANELAQPREIGGEDGGCDHGRIVFGVWCLVLWAVLA